MGTGANTAIRLGESLLGCAVNFLGEEVTSMGRLLVDLPVCLAQWLIEQPAHAVREESQGTSR